MSLGPTLVEIIRVGRFFRIQQIADRIFVHVDRHLAGNRLVLGRNCDRVCIEQKRCRSEDPPTLRVRCALAFLQDDRRQAVTFDKLPDTSRHRDDFSFGPLVMDEQVFGQSVIEFFADEHCQSVNHIDEYIVLQHDCRDAVLHFKLRSVCKRRNFAEAPEPNSRSEPRSAGRQVSAARGPAAGHSARLPASRGVPDRRRHAGTPI